MIVDNSNHFFFFFSSIISIYCMYFLDRVSMYNELNNPPKSEINVNFVVL